jgi:predicted permease
MTSHLALIEDEHMRRGLTRDEARIAARRAMGSVALAKDLHRDARSFPWLEDLRQDVRHSARSLRRSPGFTTVAVLTLALGIGANTAIFSVVNAVLLRPRPYAQPDRLVRLFVTLPPEASPTRAPLRTQGGLTDAEVGEVRSRSQSLAGIGSLWYGLVAISGREDASALGAIGMGASIFQMLDVRPLLGRVIDARDERPDAEPTMVLGHTAWLRYFGGDERVIGRDVLLENALGQRRQKRYTVVGVMPRGFEFPDGQQLVWITTPPVSDPRPNVRRTILARLKDGVTLPVATEELSGLLRGLRPDEDRRITYELVPQQNDRVTEVRPALLVLTVAVGLVLLIACINISNLQLARALTRQRETAIRAAIGAGRERLVRQALAESAVIALLGGAGGLMLGALGVRLLRGLGSTLSRIDLASNVSIPRLADVSIDVPVLGFTMIASVATGLLCGLLPALRYARPDSAVLNEGGVRSGARAFAGVRRVGGLLVVAQVSLAMMLLVGAGLLVRGFVNLVNVDRGFDGDGVLTFQVALPVGRYPDDARLMTFAERLVSRLESLPGFTGAAYGRQLPMVQLGDTLQIRRTAAPPDNRAADARFVSRDYLDVMGIRVIAGRALGANTGQGRPRPVLINESLAARDFAGENPVGQLLYISRDAVPWEIAGVVADVRQFRLERSPEPQFFVEARQWTDAGMPLFPLGPYYAVRTGGDESAVLGTIRAVVSELEAQATLFNVAPMERIVSETMRRRRLYAVLLGLFALVGVTLALTGIYGLMAYSVTQRTREIGVRVALGASRSSVLSLVLRQTMVLTVAGVGLGLLASAALTRYLEGMLFGLTPRDVPTFLGVSLLFCVVGAVAAAVPARRATGVDPLVALRSE